jgi:molecular chaperone GrpE
VAGVPVHGPDQPTATAAPTPADPAPPPDGAEAGEAPADAGTDDARGAAVPAEVEEWRDRCARLSADLQNLRRRAERERAESARYAAAPLSLGLLPVLDNLRRALAGAPQEDPLAEGLRQVVRQLEEVLAAHGVEPIVAVGRRFDPAEHEAVMAVVDGDAEDDVVTAELLPGYRLHDRVLRPARVAVSRRPG